MKKVMFNWWMPILTGVALLAVSIFLISMPAPAFVGLSILFGWLIFAIGGINLVFALSNRKGMEHWLWYLMIGLFEMILGGSLLLQPELSAQSLIIFTGMWLLFTAATRVSFSFILKKLGVRSWWWTLLSALLTIVLSFLVIINPLIGALTVVYLVAIPMFISGFMAILFGFQLRQFNSEFMM